MNQRKKRIFTTFILLITLLVFIEPTLNYHQQTKALITGLDDYKFVAFIADGFDHGEMENVFWALERMGAKNFTVAGLQLICETHTPDGTYEADMLIIDVNVSEYDCIIIPGGDGPSNLIQEDYVLEKVRQADSEGLILAAICHGPLVLAAADVVNDTLVTGYIDTQGALESAGGIYTGVNAIFDGNIVTAYTATNYLAFCWCIAKALGIIESNPPELHYYSMEQIDGKYSDKIKVIANITDENLNPIAQARFHLDTSPNIFESVPLEPNSEGLYEGEITISENGTFFLDIYVEDMYYTFTTYENLETFNVLVEKIPEEPINTNETSFAYSISAIILVYGVIAKIRKKKEKNARL